MEFVKLADHGHYYHSHSDFFHHSSDLVHAFLMKDYEIGMHEQEFYEINVVTKGSGLHYIDGRRVNAELGDVFIIPPKMGHGYIGGRDFDVFHVILSDTFMNKYVADLQQMPSFYMLFGAEPLMRGRTANPLHLSLSTGSLDAIARIMKEIASYTNFSDPVECLIRNGLAIVVIGMLCNAYNEGSERIDPNFGEDRALMKSISYIHERYFEKITIDDLTKIAHISRSSYIRKFKEICKMAPSAYLTKIRMESATNMLISTDLSLSEIASRTGFYDASHFNKTFESYYNMSPLEYRNKKT